MPDGVPASYASPNLRLALLLEDHPEAEHDFDVVPIDATDPTTGKPFIPAPFRADVEWLVVCTLKIPGMKDITAYKECLAGEGKDRAFKMDPNYYVVVQTRALGRALKRAGYPDDMGEFKNLVLWRQRNKEVAAIGSAVVPALPAAPTPAAALGEALDGVGAGEPDDDDVAEAELVEDAPSDEDLAKARYHELRNQLDNAERARFASWARKAYDIRNVANPANGSLDQLLAVLESGDAPWNDGGDDPKPGPAPAPDAQDDAADALWREQASAT